MLCVALAGLGVLAAISVALSDLSPWGKAPLGFVALAYGFWLATALAALLCAGLTFNWLLNPTRAVLEQLDVTEYRQDARV